MDELIQRVKEETERVFSREELVNFLEEQAPEKISRLYREPDRTHGEFMGGEVHIPEIVEFSSYWRRD